MYAIRTSTVTILMESALITEMSFLTVEYKGKVSV